MKKWNRSKNKIIGVNDIMKKYNFSKEQSTVILDNYISLNIWFGYDKTVYELIDYIKSFKI